MMGEKKRGLMVVILIQTINAGMFLLSKAAFIAGMNHYVYIFYRQLTATIFLSPFAFFFRWKDAPPLTFFTFCNIFVLSLFGIAICLNLYGIALAYTSATLAAATANCLPVITFFVALLLRMEVLRMKSIAGIAKGCLLMLASNTLWSIWIVLQGMMTAVTFCLQAWVIEKKGAVYVAMSTPLALIITIFFSAIFLGESITLGSSLGGMLLVGGLYFVLWGKSKEQKISEGLKEGSKECNMQGNEITKLGNETPTSSVENV